MGRTSRQKGKRGERQLCNNVLKPLGIHSFRSAQNSGKRWDDNSADVLSAMPDVRIEVKRGYNSNELYCKEVQEWIAKARDETPEGQKWLIAWRRDRKQWEFIFGIDTPLGEIAVKSADAEKTIAYLLGTAEYHDVLLETHS